MHNEYCMQLGSIKLVPLSEEDSEKMRVLRNENRNCFVYSGEISKQAQAAWYQNYLERLNDYMFSVIYVPAEVWIGAVGLYDIADGEAEFGRLLVDGTTVGKHGLGVPVTTAACRIGFELMGLHRIRLEVYADNVAAIKTYERAVFSYSGKCKDNTGCDMLCMEIFNNSSK